MLFVSDFSKIKNFLTRIAIGFVIGASMMIPGLSGGTAAILFGVFYQIMEAVNNIFKKFKSNFLYLLPFAVGGIIGFVLSSLPIKFLLDNFKFQFSFFIIGIILGSVNIFFKNKDLNFKNMIMTILGIILVLCQSIIKNNYINVDENYLFICIIGLLSAIALILPGISFTNILISFGCYESFVINVSQFNVLYLIMFAVSLVMGTSLFSNIIMKVYKKYPDSVDMLLSGLIIASIFDLYQGMPGGIEMFQCILLLIGGFCSSFALSGAKK